MKDIFDDVTRVGLAAVIILCGISISSWYMEGWSGTTIVFVAASVYASFLLVRYIQKIISIEDTLVEKDPEGDKV